MENESSPKTSEEQTEKQPVLAAIIPYAILGILFVAIIGLWYWWGNYYVLELAKEWRERLPPEVPTVAITLSELGQVGDLFGGINALFASLAFIGVGCAAYYQRKTFVQQRADSKTSQQAFAASLAQQKIDTAANKTAVDESKDASREQINTAKTELFNSFFFRMLSEVDATMRNVKLVPKSVFGQWHPDTKLYNQQDEQLLFIETMEHIDSELNGVWNQIKYYDLLSQNEKDIRKYDPVNFVVNYHNKIYKPNRRTLAPFLRNFYHTFTIIKEQKISYSEQCKYSKIARASVNEQILILVMLNGLSKEGKNLKPIIEEYGLLKHLSDDGNTTHARLIAKRFYHRTAFLGYGERNVHHTQKEMEASLK